MNDPRADADFIMDYYELSAVWEPYNLDMKDVIRGHMDSPVKIGPVKEVPLVKWIETYYRCIKVK